LEEVAKIYHIEWATQKIRKVAKAKVRKKAEKQRLVEEKEKKWLEYIKQPQNKVLANDTEASQVIESKHKEITNISLEDETKQWPPKKTKEK